MSVFSRLFICLLCLASFSALGQNQFKVGKIWALDGQVKSVQILDEDWKNNPRSLSIRKDSLSNVQELALEEIQGFQIGEELKYLKATVLVDHSSLVTSKLDNSPAPKFQQETVLLQVLFEGEFNLYFYQNHTLNLLFFSQGNDSIIPLSYKLYSPFGREVRENNYFRQQLNEAFSNWPEIEHKSKYLSYQRKAILQLFRDYHLQKGLSFKEYQRLKRPSPFSFSLTASSRYYQLHLNQYRAWYNTDLYFPTKLSYSFGLRTAWTLPFHNRSWEFIVEANYYKIDAQGTDVRNPGAFNERKVDFELSYEAIEFPIMIRRYWFLSPSQKIFANAGAKINYRLSGELSSEIIHPALAVYTNHSLNANIGLGYEFRNLSLELRYNAFQDLLLGEVLWRTEFSTLDLVLAYRF
ncbi:outer membrane beta-barrel protein [Croceimicrobium hydrocarbonivorans]|uniref:Outer membrane beta-barrel protein n=1 Tax=Croceimicrobium hydrocarbonivorans TaxID=2761580 RepID=A0A7H0VBP5_9FLAO|nr:outer membrane beta-barrel protein [Croceimicrobium hydrocarbonivorans]QNR23143.1 outer membrane beta-barrel protein [Croceimicrobium hydrocarbonivorans]